VTHAEIAELLGAYALDAVSAEEAVEIEEHLAECPRCRAEVSAHREVAGVLGNLSGTAPAGLWSRIADELAIGSDGPVTPAAADAPPLGRPTFSTFNRPGRQDEAETGTDAAGEVATTPAPVISIDSARAPGGARPGRAGNVPPAGARRRTVVLGAVVALAAALAIVVGVLSSKVVNLDNRVSALSSGILAGGVKAQVAAAESEPGSVTLDLTSTNSRWSAKVVAVPGGQAFLLPGAMPTISAGETFQAWAVVGGKYVSLGVLGRSPGDVALQLQPGMSRLLVNTEPEGGSPQPTTEPLIAAALPKTL
jgi:hypothetical protein